MLVKLNYCISASPMMHRFWLQVQLEIGEVDEWYVDGMGWWVVDGRIDGHLFFIFLMNIVHVRWFGG